MCVRVLHRYTCKTMGWLKDSVCVCIRAYVCVGFANVITVPDVPWFIRGGRRGGMSGGLCQVLVAHWNAIIT